ncbi:3-hydroxybutyryl-CoA dehydrogenase [Salinarchaeum sp. IM2453]|uniref:3-hydroxyacyl-CoA dehydrogenase family protein n=1 Tax=Salinarchaeum sp. IM2453 TaxID=2862870 RepID=UPI001C83F192|nr:3-hydroxybutyryl-CoA dehydrogenase [Salinarchaeum sp. IM2453]
MSYTVESIDSVGVVGAGTMGSGIAQVAASSGYNVVMRDIEQELIEEGFSNINQNLQRFVEKDQLSETEKEQIIGRIDGTTDLEDLEDIDLVIEAAVEDLEIKQSIFTELSELTDDTTVLATNTSTLSITSIASATDSPERVVGIHFMNPVPIMDGVEIVVGEKTPDEVVNLAHQFAEDLDKQTWESDDKPGFITNRILMPWINEGIRAYDEGVGTKEDIDKGMRLGTNVPMGPLELADHIGLDICLHASQTLYEELGDRYKPAYLLKRKVEANELGKKTGKGFYTYE